MVIHQLQVSAVAAEGPVLTGVERIRVARNTNAEGHAKINGLVTAADYGAVVNLNLMSEIVGGGNEIPIGWFGSNRVDTICQITEGIGAVRIGKRESLAGIKPAILIAIEIDSDILQTILKSLAGAAEVGVVIGNASHLRHLVIGEVEVARELAGNCRYRNVQSLRSC